MTPTGPDRTEARGSGPSQQAEQQGLGLVVSGVAGQCVGAECCLTDRTGSCFEVGSVIDVDVRQVERHAEMGSDRSGGVGVVVSGVAQPVVDVNGRDVAFRSDRECHQRAGVGTP